jgi:peptidoglycan hydrolase-like protein with peptidoglycan-binding domain
LTGPADGSAVGGPRLPRRRLLALGAVGVAGAGGAALSALLWRTSSQPTPAAAVPPATTTVTRTTLVDVRTVPGTLAYGIKHQLESPLAGMITWLPSVGAVVKRGQALVRVDDQPVILLYGRLPAYRDLTAGSPPSTQPPSTEPPSTQPPSTSAASSAVKGADVKQFEENLRALGYLTWAPDATYTESTARAVKSWQRDLDLEPTGTVELGRVFYAAGPVRIAAQALAVGQRIQGPILVYTATGRMVTAILKPHEHDLARERGQVMVALPNGREVAGTVVSTRTAPASAEGGNGEPGIEVHVALTDAGSVRGVDDGPVQVRFTVEERKDVFVVPVAALLALAEGGYGLEIVEGGATRVIAVETGLFANGNVEVSGPDLREGMAVGIAP